MLISELAARTGVSARALRHYDRSGLLPAGRLPNGYRDFPATAVEQVRRIRVLLDAGLNVTAVAELLGCFTADGRLGGCEAARKRLAAQVDIVDRALDALQRTRGLLVSALTEALTPADGDPGAGETVNAAV
jgi:DNA-binding transcriptional MerR regulator